MSSVSERTILISILIGIICATIFCISGLATSGWNGHTIFSTVTLIVAVLGVISLLSLVACVVMAAILVTGIIRHERFPFIFVSLLIISSVFILGTFTSYFYSVHYYSYSLMVTAFIFTYLSSIIATYWLFGVHGTNEKKMIYAKHQQPKLDILT